jgi:hypothetical protein
MLLSIGEADSRSLALGELRGITKARERSGQFVGFPPQVVEQGASFADGLL